MRLFACLIVAPQRGYDEPAILSYAISSFCPTSADGLQISLIDMSSIDCFRINRLNSATSVAGGSSAPSGTSLSGGRLKPSNGRSMGPLADPLLMSPGFSASDRASAVQAPTIVTAGWLIVVDSSFIVSAVMMISQEL